MFLASKLFLFLYGSTLRDAGGGPFPGGEENLYLSVPSRPDKVKAKIPRIHTILTRPIGA